MRGVINYACMGFHQKDKKYIPDYDQVKFHELRDDAVQKCV